VTVIIDRFLSWRELARVSRGEDLGLTPAAWTRVERARQIVDALAACKPVVRGDMLRLGITVPAVIRALNERATTDGYQEIVQTGYIQFADETAVKIDRATAAQVQAWFSERAVERRRAGAELSTGRLQWVGRVTDMSAEAGMVMITVPQEILKKLQTEREYLIDISWDINKEVHS